MGLAVCGGDLQCSRSRAAGGTEGSPGVSDGTRIKHLGATGLEICRFMSSIALPQRKATPNVAPSPIVGDEALPSWSSERGSPGMPAADGPEHTLLQPVEEYTAEPVGGGVGVGGLMFGDGSRAVLAEIERLSARSQWLLWFLAMSVAVVLLTVFAWIGFGSAIILVMVVMFGWAIAKSWTDVNFLHRETVLASQQVDQLLEFNDIATFLLQARRSLFRSHINALHEIFLASPQISQDNLVEILHSRLLARNRVVDLFGSILITLGLIGTIIGLIGMMGGMEIAVTGADGDSGAMADGMMQSLGGMSTAFYTTLIGAIFGGVMIRILTNVVDASIMRYTAHLAELTEVHVLPAMRRTAASLEASGYYRNLT